MLLLNGKITIFKGFKNKIGLKYGTMFLTEQISV